MDYTTVYKEKNINTNFNPRKQRFIKNLTKKVDTLNKYINYLSHKRFNSSSRVLAIYIDDIKDYLKNYEEIIRYILNVEIYIHKYEYIKDKKHINNYNKLLNLYSKKYGRLKINYKKMNNHNEKFQSTKYTCIKYEKYFLISDSDSDSDFD